MPKYSGTQKKEFGMHGGNFITKQNITGKVKGTVERKIEK
jgi:hypothetical protein